MVKNIKSILEEHSKKSLLKREKKKRVFFPYRLRRYKKFEKYVPDLIALSKLDSELLLENETKVDIEHQFACLMILRIHDFVESIINLIAFDCYHSIYPIMRGLVESIFLLMYTKEHPEYIKRFMNKTKDRGINVPDLKKEVDNKKLNDYYNYLSKMHHANPIALKLTYYELSHPKGDIAISLKPHDYEKRYEGIIESLTSLYSLGIFYIRDIYLKDWKGENKKIK